jgi:hypothetical protein
VLLTAALNAANEATSRLGRAHPLRKLGAIAARAPDVPPSSSSQQSATVNNGELPCP